MYVLLSLINWARHMCDLGAHSAAFAPTLQSYTIVVSIKNRPFLSHCSQSLRLFGAVFFLPILPHTMSEIKQTCDIKTQTRSS